MVCPIALQGHGHVAQSSGDHLDPCVAGQPAQRLGGQRHAGIEGGSDCLVDKIVAVVVVEPLDGDVDDDGRPVGIGVVSETGPANSTSVSAQRLSNGSIELGVGIWTGLFGHASERSGKRGAGIGGELAREAHARPVGALTPAERTEPVGVIGLGFGGRLGQAGHDLELGGGSSDGVGGHGCIGVGCGQPDH